MVNLSFGSGGKKMKIKNLKQLKNVLQKVPDNDLEKFGIGVNFDSDGEITLLVEDEANIELFDKYKEFTKVISNYIKNICKWAVESYEQTISDSWKEEDDWLITSEAKTQTTDKKP